ncbi:DUF3012 domain-containing protein [Echinimonas agarilytica]|uniref:DUF3012 domain-containing protein n=1 Tax=Echinimonas agarilytica TaxID=1215918 RepID=A0AA41W4P9_9GAMM|nr:DUF3012 domain-containing protein [Echinimonas agarilytica]
MKYILSIVLVSSVALLSACSPKVGSEDWCTALEEKPKGDWTANEGGDYAKYCVFGAEPE